MNRPFTGGCACRAVTYASPHEPIFQNHCQCRDCQRRSGTGHGSWLTFPKRDEMQLRGTLQYWKAVADSGRVKVHGFCPVCGTPVSLGFEAMPDLIAVPAGSLDEPERFEPQALTFHSHGWAWDAVPASIQTFERMPVP